MSINVTVSGNPVRINRGKMVTSYDPTKKEFEKRRFMRLEQVRQQSKDIAENVRNKFRKEKSKCLTELEKEGETKLKNWQARKLLELQNQYQEALDEIGLGHKNAALLEDEDEDYMERQESNEKIARERGRMAAEKLQIEKNEESLRKAVPVQRKKLVRDLENSRSKKRKSPVKKRQIVDSDAENIVPQLTGLDDDSVDSSGSEERRRLTKKVVKDFPKEQATKELQTSASLVPTTDKAAQTMLSQEVETRPCNKFILDTRISQRIKNRSNYNNPEVDYCDLFKQSPAQTTCTCCKCPTRLEAENIQKELKTQNTQTSEMYLTQNKENQPVQSQNGHTRMPFYFTEDYQAQPLATYDENLPKIISEDFTKESRNIPQNLATESSVSRNISQNLPKESSVSRNIPQNLPKEAVSGNVPQKLTKTRYNEPSQKIPSQKHVKSEQKSTVPARPKVTLKSAKDKPVVLSNTPAQYYEHANRYARSYIPNSQIDRIEAEELVISPTILSDEEIREKMRQREAEAQQRGQVALEKERVQREYQDLLKKLPALQKQERIFEIGADKEKHHMSRERLLELEKRRQNRLDNAYEELFVRKPTMVTLPRKKDESDSPTLNLAWDVDFEPKDTNASRSEQLSGLLAHLKRQKEELLKEIESTVTKDGEKSSSSRKSKRKRSRDERPISPASSDLSTKRSKSSRKGTTLSSSPQVKILQNTSTQTTPKTELQSASTSPIAKELCPCIKDGGTSKDEMCEIVIKIKDDKPEVEINPPSAGNVRVLDETDKSKDQTVDRTVSDRKANSWKDQLTSTNSTSTSYMEPPKTRKTKRKSCNVSGASQKLDPRLLTYIKKLLDMSRASIDDLAVSAASDVSTPSHSVLETPTNNPLHQLMNVMKYFNLDFADVQKQLNYTSDASSKHYNTSESVTVTSSSSDGRYKSCVDFDSTKPTANLQQYADIAASCSKKISDLTAMIEKVREEKKKMLESSTSSSDRDLTTTSYKDLPEKKDEVDKLLDIDYDYAEKLKKLSQEEIHLEKKKHEQPNDDLLNRLQKIISDNNRTVVSSSEKKIIQEENKQPVAITAQSKSVQQTKEGATVGASAERTTVSFRPMTEEQPLFLDIPKLPKLATSMEKKNKKRPPPTKALRAVSASAPHELSTIVEADSQLSTKAESPIKSASSDDVSEVDTMETMLVSIGMEWAIPTLKKTREALAMASSSSGSKDSGEVSLKDFLSKISSNSNKSEASTTDQGISLIQVDNRRTSTPIVEQGEREAIFLTDSDLSSVREQSDKAKDLSESSKND